MGPLKICSTTFAPTWPTSKSNQALRILSRGFLSICKERFDMPPRHPFAVLNQLPWRGGERKVSWNFPCSYPWLLLLVFSLSSQKDLPVFRPALPILVLVAASPQVLPQAEHAQLPLWLLMPGVLQHSIIYLALCWAPSLPCACTDGVLQLPSLCGILSPMCWIPFCITNVFLSHALLCLIGKIRPYILLRMTPDSREVLESDTGVIWDEWPSPPSLWHSMCNSMHSCIHWLDDVLSVEGRSKGCNLMSFQM